MPVEPTTAKHLPDRTDRVVEAAATQTTDRPRGAEEQDRRLWDWVVRYAPAEPATQRALYRACAGALAQLRADAPDREAVRLMPRIVERTIDRYLARLLGVAEPFGRQARARLKVYAMTGRHAPVNRPAANAKVVPVRMDAGTPRRGSGAPGRATPANRNPAPEPAPLLPPEAPLEMPEQDLS